MVGLRPVRLGDGPHVRRPPCGAVRAAGRQPHPRMQAVGPGTLGEHPHGLVPGETRRSAGRGSAKRLHRYRRMAGPPLRDGADAFRTARPEIGTTKPDGRVTYRNGLVIDLDVANGNVAEIAAGGRVQRRIGNGIFNVPGTNGYDPGHNFGHGQSAGGARLVGFRCAYRVRPGRSRPATHAGPLAHAGACPGTCTRPPPMWSFPHGPAPSPPPSPASTRPTAAKSPLKPQRSPQPAREIP